MNALTILLLAGLGVAAYFLFFKKKDEDQQGPKDPVKPVDPVAPGVPQGSLAHGWLAMQKWADGQANRTDAYMSDWTVRGANTVVKPEPTTKVYQNKDGYFFLQMPADYYKVNGGVMTLSLVNDLSQRFGGPVKAKMLDGAELNSTVAHFSPVGPLTLIEQKEDGSFWITNR